MSASIMHMKNRYSLIVYTLFISIYLSGATYDWYRPLSLLLYCIWFIVAYLFENPKSKYLIFSRTGFIVLCFVLYYFITGVINGDFVSVIKSSLNYLLAFSPLIIFIHYLRSENRIRDLFIKISFTIYIIYLLANTYFLYNNPFIARILSNDGINGSDYFLGAGYYFSYSSAIFSVFLFQFLRSKYSNKKQLNIFYLLIIVISMILIYLTGSTITLVASTLGIITCIITGANKKLGNLNFLSSKLIIIFISVLFVSFTIPQIGHLLIDLNSNKENAVQYRLFEIGEYLAHNNSNNNNFNIRLNTMERSLNGIIKYPITGLGIFVGNNTVAAKPLGYSGHTEILDIWAMHGVIGFSLIVSIYFSSFKRLNLYYKNMYLLPILVTVLIMSIFNPFISFQSNFIIMLLIPSMVIIHRKDNIFLTGDAVRI